MWLTRIDRPIYIGKHVWIGAGAIILPGVKIEDYAVVGAGSIVTANVPKGAIVAGNPARIIKFRNIDKIKNIQNIPDYPIGSSITKKSFLDKICKPI
jgi:acetyltransferase-like isoleucine patch superfamily enzyme